MRTPLSGVVGAMYLLADTPLTTEQQEIGKCYDPVGSNNLLSEQREFVSSHSWYCTDLLQSTINCYQ